MNRSLARLLTLVLLLAAFGLALPASGALGAEHGQAADRDRNGRRRGHGGSRRLRGGDAGPQRRWERDRRRGRHGGRPRRHRAVLLRHRRWRLHGRLRRERKDSVSTIDSRETAPAAFQPDSFIDPDTGEPIPFPERVTSGLGVGVPGTIRGWEQALRRFGTKPLSELLQPSIRLANSGFVVDQTYHQQTSDNLHRFDDFTSTSETFLSDGKAPAVGSTVRNPDLAATYSRVADKGGKAFYSGRTARAIVDTVQNPPVVDGPTPQRAARPDDHDRPLRLPLPRTRPDRQLLPGLAGVRDGAAFLGRFYRR